MNLSELKKLPIGDLLQLANDMGLSNLARTRKQDIIFAILKCHAKSGEDIYGEGVLEILQDGFGFLRSAEGSYLAGPDDIYVSPSQILASTYVKVTAFPEKSAHLKMASVILPYSKLTKSTLIFLKTLKTKSFLKT